MKAAVVSEKLADHYFIACQISSKNKVKDSDKSLTEITITDQVQFDKLIDNYDWNGLLSTVEAPKLYDRLVELFSEFSSLCTKKVIIKKTSA